MRIFSELQKLHVDVKLNTELWLLIMVVGMVLVSTRVYVG